VQEKKLSQKKAAELLKISDRQVRNLLDKIEDQGPKALVSKKRGKPSNRTIHSSVKQQVLSLIQTKYEDFGPTFIVEKLQQHHQINLSDETIRQWMSQINLWIPKKKRRKTHPLRKRRDCVGELIQIDGSHHAWFENRGPECVLLVFIDDATGQLTSLHFSEGESLEGYFAALKKQLLKHGRPRAFYSDHFSVFEGTVYKDNLTQFTRALKTLDIQLIKAHSPQAKGRVERANRTLQDRLLKEMRLKGISTIEEANEYAEEFIKIYNNKFSKEPASNFDAHRPLEPKFDLHRFLTRYEERTLTKDLVFQFHNTFYKILEPTHWFKGQKVEIRRCMDGLMRVFLKDKQLKFNPLSEVEPDKFLDYSSLEWNNPKGVKSQPSTHPWKNHSYHQNLKHKEGRKVV
jgi:transposase